MRKWIVFAILLLIALAIVQPWSWSSETVNRLVIACAVMVGLIVLIAVVILLAKFYRMGQAHSAERMQGQIQDLEQQLEHVRMQKVSAKTPPVIVLTPDMLKPTATNRLRGAAQPRPRVHRTSRSVRAASQTAKRWFK